MLGLLEQSWLGSTVRATPFLYAVLESGHIIGLALLIGSAVAVDLRLLGVGRNAVPVTLATRYLLPVSRVGFAIVALTGVAMFVGNGLAVASSPAAPWKFGLIALAGLNILIFHRGIYRTVESWDLGEAPPAAAKPAALLSVSTWFGVVTAGRFLAY
ncbi:DUF6644 family protein [Enterovirga sp. CN4-39]|uniref:DUF6644 family protein n=1 Tax=Enterovirga sp. CN4-39 TaxID=3400910 RepID=UPI003C049A19